MTRSLIYLLCYINYTTSALIANLQIGFFFAHPVESISNPEIIKWPFML